MKATTYLVNYQPYPARAEHCTVGVMVFAQDGHARVHLAHNLKKVKALDPQANLESLRDSLNALAREINEKPGAWDAFKAGVAGLRFSASAGFFVYANSDEYERQVQWLLQTAAEPRSAQPRKTHQSKSRLFVELKSTFKNYGWLGEKAEDIEDHKVVTHYPVVVDEDLSAEFAMKNGRLHLVETVDFRAGVASAKRMEARGKALVFDAAKEQDSETQCTVVVAAQDYTDIKASMNLLNRYADRVAVYESATDMQSLLNDWALAMNRPMLAMPGHIGL
jgi:hypothetical protein